MIVEPFSNFFFYFIFCKFIVGVMVVDAQVTMRGDLVEAET